MAGELGDLQPSVWSTSGPTSVLFKSVKVVNIVNEYIFVYIFRDKNKTKVEVKGKQVTIRLS